MGVMGCQKSSTIIAVLFPLRGPPNHQVFPFQHGILGISNVEKLPGFYNHRKGSTESWLHLFSAAFLQIKETGGWHCYQHET